MTIEPAKHHDCRDCKHYRATAVFDLCMRPEATYKVADKVDQHTIGHMRLTYLCDEAGKLFEPQNLTYTDVMGY